MFAKQAREADLQLVAGAQQVQRRLLVTRLEGPFFLELALQLGSGHRYPSCVYYTGN